MAKVRIVQPTPNGNKFDMSQPEIQVNRTLKPVDREHSNMEIEKGEYVVTNTANTGLPETYIAGGKRHSAGGTPVELPADSFIFSRDNKMKIRDEDILKMFGKTGNKAMTPADLAKQYDINKYRQILADSNSDKLQVETAELMIANYNEKLGKLGLVQESLKGFPDGIPKIAMPYLEASGFNPSNITDPTGDTMPGNMDQAKYGAQVPIPEMYPALYQMGGGQPFLNYSQMPQANAQQQMLNSVRANNAAQIQQNKQMWNQDNNPVNLDQRSIMQGMWNMAQAVDPTPVTNIANMGVNKLKGVNQEMGDVAGVFASMIPGIKNAKKVKNFLGALDKGDDVYNVATAAYQTGGQANHWMMQRNPVIPANAKQVNSKDLGLRVNAKDQMIFLDQKGYPADSVVANPNDPKLSLYYTHGKGVMGPATPKDTNYANQWTNQNGQFYLDKQHNFYPTYGGNPQFQTKQMGGMANADVDYIFQDGGNTTKRRYSSGNKALDMEIDQLYKTGNWRKDAVEKIYEKADALGIDTGASFFNPSGFEGVFADLNNKSNIFNTEVNKEAQKNYNQRNYEGRRQLTTTDPSKLNLSGKDLQKAQQMYKEVVKTGKGADTYDKFITNIQKQNEDIAFKQKYAKTYADNYAKHLEAKKRFEDASKNTANYTAGQLKQIKEDFDNASRNLGHIEGAVRQNFGPEYQTAFSNYAKNVYVPTGAKVNKTAPKVQQTPALPEQTTSMSKMDSLKNVVMDTKSTQSSPKLKPATGGKSLKKDFSKMSDAELDAIINSQNK